MEETQDRLLSETMRTEVKEFTPNILCLKDIHYLYSGDGDCSYAGNYNKPLFADDSFISDLNLDELIEKISFSTKGGKSIANILLKNRIYLYERAYGKEVIDYRLNALSELINSQKKRKSIKEVIVKLRYIDAINSPSFYDGQRLDSIDGLGCFISEFNTMPELDDLDSDALKEVNKYFKNIKGSDTFINANKSYQHINSRMVRLQKENRLSQRDKKEMMDQCMDEASTYTPAINEFTKIMSPLDYYLGFANFFLGLKKNRFDVCRPQILKKRKVNIKNAWNPIMLDHKLENDKIVCNNIKYDPNENIFLITGANNGGKTSYVKTVGIIQLMAQCGLYVPAKSAEVSIVDGIYTHFITPDDITKGEGRYKNELRRMRKIFENATPFSLLLVDEPCGGTSYEEGQEQSMLFLKALHTLGCATYFTTHMHALTEKIENEEFPAAKNLQVEHLNENGKLIPTYKIKSGAAGKSYGNEIAQEMGLGIKDVFKIISNNAMKAGYEQLLRSN